MWCVNIKLSNWRQNPTHLLKQWRPYIPLQASNLGPAFASFSLDCLSPPGGRSRRCWHIWHFDFHRDGPGPSQRNTAIAPKAKSEMSWHHCQKITSSQSEERAWADWQRLATPKPNVWAFSFSQGCCDVLSGALSPSKQISNKYQSMCIIDPIWSEIINGWNYLTTFEMSRGCLVLKMFIYFPHIASKSDWSTGEVRFAWLGID